MVDIKDNDNMTILTILKSIFLQPVKVALVYRTLKLPVKAFIEQPFCLTYVNKVDNLLGDFNINVLSNDSSGGVDNILTQYKLIAREPIHIDGGLVDHLDLVKQCSVENHLDSIVKNTVKSVM